MDLDIPQQVGAFAGHDCRELRHYGGLVSADVAVSIRRGGCGIIL